MAESRNTYVLRQSFVDYMEEQPLNFSDLAIETGYSSRHLRRMVGTNQPGKASFWKKVCKALNLSPFEVLEPYSGVGSEADFADEAEETYEYNPEVRPSKYTVGGISKVLGLQNISEGEGAVSVLLKPDNEFEFAFSSADDAQLELLRDFREKINLAQVSNVNRYNKTFEAQIEKLEAQKPIKAAVEQLKMHGIFVLTATYRYVKFFEDIEPEIDGTMDASGDVVDGDVIPHLAHHYRDINTNIVLISDRLYTYVSAPAGPIPPTHSLGAVTVYHNDEMQPYIDE